MTCNYIQQQNEEQAIVLITNRGIDKLFNGRMSGESNQSAITPLFGKRRNVVLDRFVNASRKQPAIAPWFFAVNEEIKDSIGS